MSYSNYRPSMATHFAISLATYIWTGTIYSTNSALLRNWPSIIQTSHVPSNRTNDNQKGPSFINATIEAVDPICRSCEPFQMFFSNTKFKLRIFINNKMHFEFRPISGYHNTYLFSGPTNFKASLSSFLNDFVVPLTLMLRQAKVKIFFH